MREAQLGSVVVTAYGRPDGLARVLDDLEREGLTGARVKVYDDASPRADRALDRRIERLACRLHRAERNHGKRGWWAWWNTILTDLKAEPSGSEDDELVLVLQDDVRLCRDFTRRALEAFASIDDPSKASLHLNVTAERREIGSQCWTPVRAEAFGDVLRTGWVDMGAFVAHRRLFEALDWRLDPVPASRWVGRDELGSGVGEQISRRAHAAGLGMYQVREALVVHDGTASQMNAVARARWPMRTVDFIDGEAETARLASSRPAVLASLASIPSRTDWLREVVSRLRPQVDQLLVYLNDYPAVPAYLDDEHITVVRSGDEGDRGDAGKFFGAGQHTGVHVLCDDDIAYPDDYVQRLLAGIECYASTAVVGFHSSTLREPFGDYAHSRTISHFSRGLTADVGVHVLGTGTASYHSSTLAVRRRDFPTPNMADVWFALLGQRQQVPFVQLHREAGWLLELAQVHGTRPDGIYTRARLSGRTGGAAVGPDTAAVLSHQPWRVVPAVALTASPHEPTTDVRRAREVAQPPPARLVRVSVQGPTGAAVLVLPDGDPVTVEVQRTGTFAERDLLDAVRELGLHGTYVDLGARHGNHTAWFALECEADRVVIAEPDGAALAGLRESIAASRIAHRVDVRPVLVHPTWRRASPVPGAKRFRSDAAGLVEAVTLDALLGATTGAVAPVALIRVGVAGLSGEILASGRRTLLHDRPVVVALAHGPSEEAAVRTALEPLGYTAAGSFGATPSWLWSPRPRRA